MTRSSTDRWRRGRRSSATTRGDAPPGPSALLATCAALLALVVISIWIAGIGDHERRERPRISIERAAAPALIQPGGAAPHDARVTPRKIIHIVQPAGGVAVGGSLGATPPASVELDRIAGEEQLPPDEVTK